MIKSIATSLIILLGVLFISSCSKKTSEDCGTVITTTYNLYPGEKKVLPYTGTDTFVLVNAALDTMAFVGQGIKSSYIRSETTANHPAGCPADIEYYEVDSIYYRNLTDNSFLIIVQNKKGLMMSFIFKGLVFPIAIDQVGHNSDPNYQATYLVGSTTYTDVNLIMNDPIIPIFLAYNRTKGILQFVLSPTETWNIR